MGRILERQIRINGIAERISTLESIDYFKSRPRAAQIGACTSDQSKELASRELAEARIAEIEKQFAGKDVEKPPLWGGFCIKPETIEFWYRPPLTASTTACATHAYLMLNGRLNG